MRFLNLADTFDIDLDDFSIDTVQTPNLPDTPITPPKLLNLLNISCS